MLLFYNKPSKADSFALLSEPLPGCWIHVDEAKQEDLQEVCTLTGLDPSLLYDALDRYELPRLERAGDDLLLFIRHPLEEEKALYTGTLTLLLTPNYFITISPVKSFLIQNVLQKKGFVSSSSHSDWMRNLLLWIEQEFNVFIRKIRHSVLSQEKDLGSVTSEDIYALTKYEETLNQYLASLESLLLTLEKLFAMDSTRVYKQKKEMVEDIINHVKQSCSLCEILIKNIRSLRDAYQIIFANSLTKTIKLLTALTIVFTIPNIVASVYGMNVKLPFAEAPGAFSIIMAIMVLLSCLCGYWFYRKKLM